MSFVFADNCCFYKILNLPILSLLSILRDKYICCNKNKPLIHQIKKQWQSTTAITMAAAM